MKIKYISYILLTLLVTGCSTNPPKPTMPTGKWVQMNTQVPAAKLQLQKIKAAKGGN